MELNVNLEVRSENGFDCSGYADAQAFEQIKNHGRNDPSMLELETIFKALGDMNRLRIVNLLLHGELCVCDIQYVLENSQSNISRHLAYLKRSEMVLDRRDGYRVFYRLASTKESEKKLLFDFLRGIFQREAQLTRDTERLKEAIASGSCTLSEWKPFSAIRRNRNLKTACSPA